MRPVCVVLEETSDLVGMVRALLKPDPHEASGLVQQQPTAEPGAAPMVTDSLIAPGEQH